MSFFNAHLSFLYFVTYKTPLLRTKLFTNLFFCDMLSYKDRKLQEGDFMEFAKERIFVRQAVRGTLGSNKPGDIRYTLRTLDSRMFYIISGNGEVTIEDTTYSLYPGSVVLFKAGTPYMWNVTEMQFYILNFDYTYKYSDIKGTFHPIHTENFPEAECLDCGSILDEPMLNTPIVVRAASNLEALFKLTVEEYGVGGKYSEELISNAVKTLIYSVLKYKCEGTRAAEEKGSQLVRDIISYIGENLNADISNTTIAEKFHFNASYINRVFKKHTGTTLHEYILSVRIDVAAEKLRSESTSVSEIAKFTGFSGAVHFTKAFRKRMGMSPTDYRNM